MSAPQRTRSKPAPRPSDCVLRLKAALRRSGVPQSLQPDPTINVAKSPRATATRSRLKSAVVKCWTTVEIEAGHLSLVSHPKEIANLILAAAHAK